MASRVLDFDFKTYNADFDEARARQMAFRKSDALASRMSEAFANQLKIALLRMRKFATGKTFRSVQSERVLSSPSRLLIVSRVVASRSIVNIVKGRAPRLKPPPVSALVEWASALGIPQSALHAIAKAIGRRGIKPKDVQTRAVNQSQKAWREAIQNFLQDFARDLFRQIR